MIMKNRHRKLLLRSLEGDLSSQDEARLRKLLAESAEAAAELRQLESLKRLVSESAAPTFAPGFTGRVMSAVGSESRAQADNGRALADYLAPVFNRVAVAGVAVVLALGALGLAEGSNDSGQSALEAVLGLPAYTFESAYEVDDELLALLAEPAEPEVTR
jgi:anti-sigma factor RsiW